MDRIGRSGGEPPARWHTAMALTTEGMFTVPITAGF
jgi:hypothetical protein